MGYSDKQRAQFKSIVLKLPKKNENAKKIESANYRKIFFLLVKIKGSRLSRQFSSIKVCKKKQKKMTV